MLEATAYRYLARPRLHPDKPGSGGMNCRGLVQDWFWDQHRLWLGRDQIEQPGLWHHTGAFVPLAGTDDVDRLNRLPHETVVLVERTRTGDGAPVDNGPSRWRDVEQYRMRLHTALVVDPSVMELDHAVAPDVPRVGLVPGEPVMVHATASQGCLCIWGLDMFVRHYRLVAAKNVAPAPPAASA